MPRAYEHATEYKRSASRAALSESLDSEGPVPGETIPVEEGLEWAAYCAAIGVDANAARASSEVSALHSMLGAGGSPRIDRDASGPIKEK